MPIDVLFIGSDQIGWGPIDRLAELAADLLGGTLFRHGSKSSGAARKLLSKMDRTTPGSDRGLLVIAQYPYQLVSDAVPPGTFRKYQFAGIWLIDSYWRESAPKRWRIGPYDWIAVNRPNDVDFYMDRTGKHVFPLSWGTDALELGSANTERAVDVMRIGRQPEAWDTDDKTAGRLAQHGLCFAGRPEMMPDPKQNHQNVVKLLAQTRFTIAFSNLAAPAAYTHDKQEYLTARWMDALGAGAVVAGIPPHTDETMKLLWPEALLEFASLEFEENLDKLVAAAEAWTPDVPLINHRLALERLDWRWRLAEIAKIVNLQAPKLEQSLTKVTDRIAQLTQEGGLEKPLSQ